jgi:glyoxylase-like metal-dependent hydrolase (beta-lactamase superfamily II)
VILETIRDLGPFLNNIYILADSKEAVVVDASFMAEAIVERIEAMEVRVRTILLTHGHIDHIVGAGRLKERTGAEIAIGEKDLWLYEHVEEQGRLFGFGAERLPAPDRFLREGDEVRFGAGVLKILETPGHTPGSVCGLFESEGRPVVLTGDTLLCGSIGRTDLWGGSAEEIARSIRGKLYSLPAQTRVLPGHGEETDMGTEATQNPFVRG